MRDHSAYHDRPSDLPSSSAEQDLLLLIDDDQACREPLAGSLREAGFAVETEEDGAAGLASARRLQPALIISEVTLPGLSGLEVCRELRADAATAEIRFVMLTDRQAEFDRILGFEFGADEYVAKPCSLREMVLRVKALLRRTKAEATRNVVKAGSIAVDRARCCALVDGTAIDLTPTEFRLLSVLAERPNIVQSRDTLLSQVWGDERPIENRSVDTYLRRLRNKLGQAGRHIKTVYGFGYRIAC